MVLPETIRAFISVDLPSAVGDAIAEMEKALRGAAKGGEIRWLPPDQIHLTLKFLGNISGVSVPELESALRRAAACVDPFDLTAEGLGGFPSLIRPRVLWVGLAGNLESLRALREKVMAETKAWGEDEAREFHPHLTIARVKDAGPREVKAVARKMESLATAAFGNWRVSEMRLVRSELGADGARHTPLATISLP